MDSKISREILESIVAAASDGIIVINVDSEILLFNDEAVNLFGYSEEEVLGKNITMIIPEEYRPGHDDKVRDFAEGNLARVSLESRDELIAIRKDGSTFPVGITISKVNTEKGAYCTAIIRDLTERMQAREELVALNASKDKFLGMAAHDLRSPLGKIKMVGELIKDGFVEGEQLDELLGILLRTTDSMLLLINDLLDLTKIESGRIDLNVEKVDAKGYFQEVRSSNALLGKNKDISLSLQLEEGLPSLYFDPRRINQVMNNLLSNAFKFSETGTEVVIIVEPDESGVRIAVVDQGQGIKEDEFGKVFGEFQQLSTKSTKGETGSGLGLAISKKIVELHNGTIGFESSWGEGSTFYFILPDGDPDS